MGGVTNERRLVDRPALRPKQCEGDMWMSHVSGTELFELSPRLERSFRSIRDSNCQTVS